MDWYRFANGQQYLPFYDTSEYHPIPSEQEQTDWADPAQNPVMALEDMIESYPEQVDEFLAAFPDYYDVYEVSFESAGEEKKAEPVTVVQVARHPYVLEGEYITEADEWVRDIPDYDLGSYVGYQDFNQEFWEFPPGTLWHGTTEEALPLIMKEGLDTRSDTRAMSNKYVGSAVFTSPDPAAAMYNYQAVVEINVAAMKADGYMPRASQEDPFESENMRSALASKIGIRDWTGGEYYSEGLADDTIVFFGPIPAKYLTVYRDPTQAWVQRECKFAQDQQLLLPFYDPSEYSTDPKEVQPDISDYMPEGMEEEEWATGFYHVTTNLPAVLSEGALLSRSQLEDPVGLGGGGENVAPTKVSVTHSEGQAYKLADAMRFAAEVAHGQAKPSLILWEFMQNHAFDDVWPDTALHSYLSGIGVPSSLIDPEGDEGLDEWLDANIALGQQAYEFMQNVDENLLADAERLGSEGAEPGQYTGFTMPFEVFSQINPKDIGIVQVMARKDAVPEHVPGELELRFDPDDIMLLQDQPTILSWLKENCKFASADPDAYEEYRHSVEIRAADNPYPFKEWFDQSGRAYFPFQEVGGDPEGAETGFDPDVAAELGDGGCTIIDYQRGYCQCGGRTLRIGRVLQQRKKNALQDLQQRFDAGEIYDLERERSSTAAYYDDIIGQFSNSAYRSARSQGRAGFMVVISQDPHDVAAMSTGRNWTSCMELGSGSHYEDIYCEVASGGLVAYLIRKDDQDIHKPLARIHIRRFENRQGQSIAVPEQSIYGDDVAGFAEAVSGWLNARQGELSGMYQRKGGEYSDTFGDDDMLIAPENQDGIVKWLRGEHEDALYSTWSVNDDMHESADGWFGRENPVEDLSRTFDSKEEAERYLEIVRNTEQDEYNRELMSEEWSTVDEETGKWEWDRFALNEETHDYRRDMKNIASEKILDAPPGTYSDEIMQEVKKHVWDGTIYGNLKNKLLKKRPDLLSEKDIADLTDQDSLDYIGAIPPEQRGEHLASWQRDIEMYLDEPDLIVEPRIEESVKKYQANQDATSPSSRTWLDEAAAGVLGVTHKVILDPLKTLFNPVPEVINQKLVDYLSKVDETFGAPISESRYYDQLLGNAVHTFTQTDTDTPTVQKFYESLLPRIKLPKGRRRTYGITFESIGYAIAKLGENGTRFLPWIEENLASETQRMEALRAEEEPLDINEAKSMVESRKTAEDNVEKLLYMQDSITNGTGHSTKYRFFYDKRWAQRWLRDNCKFAAGNDFEDMFGDPKAPEGPERQEVSRERKSDPFTVTLYRGFDADLKALERQGDKMVLSPRKGEAGVLWFAHSLQLGGGRPYAESRGAKYLLEYPLSATRHYDLVTYDDGSTGESVPQDIPQPDWTQDQPLMRYGDSYVELPEGFMFSYKMEKHIVGDRDLAVDPSMISDVPSDPSEGAEPG